jgi:hypothetical protein
MTLVNDKGNWRVVGQGAERATVAFAQVVSGQLKYETEGGSLVEPL